jgi:signal transduction histidine kinase
MGWNTMLMSMLAAVFAMAGTQHLLVFLRNRAAVEHGWFSATALAAAATAAVGWPVSRELSPTTSMSHHLPSLFAAAWLITATWFGVKYAYGDQKRCSIALIATLLAAIAGAGGLAFPRSSPEPWRLVGLAALAIIIPLTMDGMVRLWSSARRVRAAALAGMGLALSIVAVEGALQGNGFPRMQLAALCGFLVVAVILAYELAGVVVDADAASQRPQQGLAHTSRLAIVGELTASLAHEINQPLGAILSNADAGEILLENPEPPLDEIRQIFADIRRDGVRASDVIRHVRKLVRNRELELETLDANAVATEVAALLAPQARGRRVGISLRLRPQPAYLRGDRALMVQVLINLIINAMDAVEALGTADDAHSPRPPVIVEVTTTGHGEIEFQITDAGIGIPVERLGHLFDSFYTSKAHGMGLGLAISRSIIEAHGGRIHVQNNRGAGATFRVTLPPLVAVDARQPS